MKAKEGFSGFTLTLTDRKAFYLFISCFLFGGFILFNDFHAFVVLPVVVLVYALVLFYSSRRFFVSLGVETKNSPYFLGFLFTLSCLIRIFMRLPAGQFDGHADLFAFLVPQIGAALSTSIAGLIGRYMIISFDPTEEEQQELWRIATEELKKNSAAYQTSQRNLIELVQEFVEAHNEILEQEEKASRRHIAVLSETSGTLEKISNEYPDKIKGFLGVFDAIQERFDKFIEETLPKVHADLTEGTSFQLEKLYNDFIRIAKSAFSKMSNNLEGLEEKISKFDQSFELVFSKIPETHNLVLMESADKLKAFQQDYLHHLGLNLGEITTHSKSLSEGIKQTASHIQHCNEVFDKQFSQNLELASHGLKDMAELSRVSQSLNGDISEGLATQIKSFEEVFSARLETFQSEIKQIDNLIDSFITATRKRILN